MEAVKEDIRLMDAEQLRRLAESGDPAAQVAWATCLRQGHGVARDKEEAVRWLEKAAEQHDPEGLYQLGRCAEDGNGMPQDESRAAVCFAEAAQLGHAKAQYAYGMCLLGGIGCRIDKAEALRWLQAAADNGVAQAKAEVEKLRQDWENQEPAVEPQTVKPVSDAADVQSFTPVNPEPYRHKDAKTTKNDKDSEEEQDLQPMEEEAPQPKNSTALFLVVFLVCGGLCGCLMQPVYSAMSIRDMIDSDVVMTLFMVVVGVLSGLVLSLPFRGLYRRAKEVLPFYGLLLLLPLLTFLLAGIVFTIIRVVMWIIAILIGLTLLGYFFG